MKIRLVSYTVLAAIAFLSFAALADSRPDAEKAVLDRGRYLVWVGQCNDCHTPGFPEAAGKIAQERWLTGNSVGFQGPWGTNYPKNLRLYMQNVSEEQWLARVRKPMGPPMPWFTLRDMADSDLLAIYHFVRSLGPAGEPAPAAVGPGVAVTTPYIEFFPKNLPKQAGN
jgi:mono/diheme cytochrome c family protein